MKPWMPFAELAALVAKRNALTPTALLGRRRNNRLVRARWELAWLCTRLSGESIASVARRMDRDHTTLLNGLARLRQCLRTDSDYAADLSKFEEEVADELLLPPADLGGLTASRRKLAGRVTAATTFMLDRIIAAMADDPLGTIARINRALDPEAPAYASRPARAEQLHHRPAPAAAAPSLNAV